MKMKCGNEIKVYLCLYMMLIIVLRRKNLNRQATLCKKEKLEQPKKMTLGASAAIISCDTEKTKCMDKHYNLLKIITITNLPSKQRMHRSCIFFLLAYLLVCLFI